MWYQRPLETQKDKLQIEEKNWRPTTYALFILIERRPRAYLTASNYDETPPLQLHRQYTYFPFTNLHFIPHARFLNYLGIKAAGLDYT